jgi:PTS system mannose-specific IIA component
LSIALLIITHNQIGQELIETARAMFGQLPVAAEAIRVDRGDDPERLQADADRIARQLDQGDGVLLLSDMFGSTPGNIANRLAATGNRRVVYGVNLPMVVRVLNYAALDLDGVVDKAMSGGREGVVCEEDG